jgi:hypothetical protein
MLVKLLADAAGTYLLTKLPRPWFNRRGATRIINSLCDSVFFDLAHFILGRKQLLETKRLVESRSEKIKP